MFYRAEFQPGDKFIYGIYSIQYQGQSPNGQQLSLIQKFDKFITGKAYLDRITVPGTNEMSIQIWLPYWWSETIVTVFPDNICFLVEGQDHSGMSAREKGLWFEDFDELVTGWMGYLAKDPTGNGLFDVRMGHVSDRGTFKAETPVNLNHSRKIKMFY
ncbi:hypothetical protein LZL87_012244 [Fusarium oxysporum]|nr:hypothetical protein LZL87_012244 [Fusarium oxysporum]